MGAIFTRDEIEDMVLGIAEVIQESRSLRIENNYLRLKVAKSDAFTNTLVCSSPRAKRKYEILREIEDKNRRAYFRNGFGFMTNEDYMFDWEDEVERRLKQEGLKSE